MLGSDVISIPGRCPSGAGRRDDGRRNAEYTESGSAAQSAKLAFGCLKNRRSRAPSIAFLIGALDNPPCLLFRQDKALGGPPSDELEVDAAEAISLPPEAGSLADLPFGGAAGEPQGAREAAPRLVFAGSCRVQILSLPATPLPPLLFAASGKGSASCGKRKGEERRTQGRADKNMEKNELEDLRVRVPCAAVLEKAGFAVDLKESTRKAVKYRRGGEIVIVIHGGRGWFDPLSDAKGDVFTLIEHLDRLPFVKALDRAASLIGFVPTEPTWTQAPREIEPPAISDRWRKRRKPWPGSMTWRYLHRERCIPDAIISAAARNDLLREGPRGSMWAAHRNGEGILAGWEERGPEWRGFSSGGAKELFGLGPMDALRLCVTEAAIDAMSLAALESIRADSLYLSTGGGWSPTTDTAIRVLAARPGVLLLAATDNNVQGERYAERLKSTAGEARCNFDRLRPTEVDWNAELKARPRNERKGREAEEGRLPHARRSRQG